MGASERFTLVFLSVTLIIGTESASKTEQTLNSHRASAAMRLFAIPNVSDAITEILSSEAADESSCLYIIPTSCLVGVMRD